MLYRLEIENFYSFRDRQIIDLTVGRSVPDYPERFAPIYRGSDLRAPKVVSLFGPNGSGKTNALKALSFVAWFLRESFSYNGTVMPCEVFNNSETSSQPVRLAIEIGANLNFSDDNDALSQFGQIRYELELAADNYNIRTVVRETLRQRLNGIGKWTRVFERVTGQPLLGSKSFPLGGYSKVIDKIRPNASVVATLALFEHPAAKIILNAASRVVSNIFIDRMDPTQQQTAQLLVSNPQIVAGLNQDLQRIDVGIDKIEIRQQGAGLQPLFSHHGLAVAMPLNMESHGTQSFIKQYPFIYLALQNGGIAILDELDSLIHPLILPEVLRWFYDPVRNPYNAQLWMSCHSVSLLEELMKEEVVLCEKDRQGRSHLFSLMDVQAVRRSDNLYKKYMGGAYGAVPQLG